MKPLLGTKAPRLDPGVKPISEWEPAEHHLTVDGVQAFAARQKARLAAVQAKQVNVRPIKRLKAE